MEYTKGEWERHNAPNGEHIWCGDKHIADIVTDVDSPEWNSSVGEIAQSAILFHNNPKYKAAPDLYEACKAMLDYYQGIHKIPENIPQFNKALRACDTATKKAEGK